MLRVRMLRVRINGAQMKMARFPGPFPHSVYGLNRWFAFDVPHHTFDGPNTSDHTVNPMCVASVAQRFRDLLHGIHQRMRRPDDRIFRVGDFHYISPLLN